jgi:hypothetical protein
MIRHSRACASLLLVILVVLAAAIAGGGQARAARNEATAGPPGASVGVRLAQAPVGEHDDPRAYAYIIDHLAPGTTMHREFQVSDRGSKPAHVVVYAAAASISGGTFLFSAGHTPNEMTTWVSVSRPVVNLKPHQTVTEVATIAVPRDASGGEQYGVLWAQVGQLGSGNIELVSRVGIRIYLSVGPGGAPPSSFTMGTPAAARVNGHPVLRIPVRNTGGRAVDITATVSLSGGPEGLRDGPFRADSIVTLAPAQSGTVVYRLPAALPSGPWQARVVMQSGPITLNRQFAVDFIGTVQAAQGLPVALMTGLSLAALIVIIAALLFFHWRRRRGGGHGGSVTVDQLIGDPEMWQPDGH